ncbi:hypothetical protein AcW2_000570 [Taiwanofungus camphoratus]|nr:hypothetical protein AcW2_000570 [Antrodia cinnamomea]
MHFHVLGFGAVGTLVAHHLRAALDAKHIISIIHREPNKAALVRRLTGGLVKVERDGVVRSEAGFTHESYDPFDDLVAQRKARPLFTGANLAHTQGSSDSSPIQSLIVALKATVAFDCIERLVPRLSANSTIVLLHNGMGTYEALLKKVFRNREQQPHIVVSVNNHGAWSKGFGYAVHAGVGDMQLGILPDTRGRNYEASLQPDLPKALQTLNLDDITPISGDPQAERYISLRETIAALQSAEGLHAHWGPIYDVHIAMRRKLVVNSVINPLTALLGCSNGQLFEDAAGMRLCTRLCQEASSVFRAQWFTEMRASRTAEDVNTSPLDKESFPHELTGSSLAQECVRVANLTRTNMSSMLVDVRKGKHTEIGYMNGYIMKLAKKYGVSVPLMASMVDLMTIRQTVPLDTLVPVHSVL